MVVLYDGNSSSLLLALTTCRQIELRAHLVTFGCNTPGKL